MTDQNKLDAIEARLRRIAGAFTGVWVGQQVPADYHGPTRGVGVTFVDDRGADQDVGDELLSIADDVAALSLPVVVFDKPKH